VTNSFGDGKLRLEVVKDFTLVPQQTNGNDFGVGLTLQVQRVSKGLLEQPVTAERYFCTRGHIAVELMLGHLLPWQ
jgi:hypothetical protein